MALLALIGRYRLFAEGSTIYGKIPQLPVTG
jgi:hypothetical protein